MGNEPESAPFRQPCSVSFHFGGRAHKPPATPCSNGPCAGVSAVGGSEHLRIRTSRTATLNSERLKEHPTRTAILLGAEALLPELRGLARSKDAFKNPTPAAPFSYELPQAGGLHPNSTLISSIHPKYTLNAP
jgi:hypothetical protein